MPFYRHNFTSYSKFLGRNTQDNLSHLGEYLCKVFHPIKRIVAKQQTKTQTDEINLFSPYLFKPNHVTNGAKYYRIISKGNIG